MASGYNLTDADAIVKQLYTKDAIEDVTYQVNPFLAIVAKKQGMFLGSKLNVPVKYGFSQAGSADFATAQALAASSASKWADFQITRIDEFNVATIDQSANAATRNQEGAFVELVEEAVDSAIKGVSQRIGKSMYGSSWGDLGQVGATSSGSTIVLKVPNDVKAFEVGQYVQFSASQHADTLRDSAKALKVIGRDVTAGSLTMSAALSTVASLGPNDYIFSKGDREDSATPTKRKIAGLESWLPATAPGSGDSHFGFDRSVEVSRLAGQRMVGTGNMEEDLINGADLVASEGGALSHFLMSHSTLSNFTKSLGSKVTYPSSEDGKEAKVGFSAISIATASGMVKLVADKNCPSNRIFGVDLSSWYLATLEDGAPVHIFDADGLTWIRKSDAHAMELRVNFTGNLVCKAPGHNINIQI